MASTNGKPNGRVRSEDKVRVAIVGVGNCANSLLQGVEYYKDADPETFVPGLMHVDLGGYHVRDVEFTAAFDVTRDKVGKDLADAIWAHPNDTYFADVPKTGVTVSRGMTHDGLGKYISEVVEEGTGRHRRRGRDPEGDEHGRRRQLPAGRLRGGHQVVHGADPQGGLRDGELHAGLHRQGRLFRQAVRAAGAPDHRRRHQVPGRRDDHAPRAHVALPRARPSISTGRCSSTSAGTRTSSTCWSASGWSKKISKTNAVTSMLDYDMGAGNVHVGPPTTCHGSPTASGRTSAWRAPPSVTCRSTSR